MSELTKEQAALLGALTKDGHGTAYSVAARLTDRARGILWSSQRAGRVMRQLKYRALIEFKNGTWHPTPA